MTRSVQTLILALAIIAGALILGWMLRSPSPDSVAQAQSAPPNTGEGNPVFANVSAAPQPVPAPVSPPGMNQAEPPSPQPPAPAPFPRSGTALTGTCNVSEGGRAIMSGNCDGVSHGTSLVLTAARDGCTVELTRRGERVSGAVYAYRDSCPRDGDYEIEGDVQLGSFHREGSCWVAASARICLQ